MASCRWLFVVVSLLQLVCALQALRINHVKFFQSLAALDVEFSDPTDRAGENSKG